MSRCRGADCDSMSQELIRIATRGSALALAQAHRVRDRCQALFPEVRFEITIFKTTGDKLQSVSLSQPGGSLPKGLFTKELEIALLEGEADLAVHSLKDLPTTLPDGLCLGAVAERADIRDVLIVRAAAQTLTFPERDSKPDLSAAGLRLHELPQGAVVGTSSTRRRAQLLDARSDLRVVEIRGNVLTRLEKVARSTELDATVLALAGLERLGIRVETDRRVTGAKVPEGLRGAVLDLQTMLPCVGQGALGIEVRSADDRIADICRALDDSASHACVRAERAFLAAIGGGCQSPVAAYATLIGNQLRIQAVSFVEGSIRRGEQTGPVSDAAGLGVQLANDLHPKRRDSGC
jgi:hydroxymethylbilane synthase